MGLVASTSPPESVENGVEGCLTLCGVISANVGCELLVALRLEVARHFSERCAGGISGRFEPPVTVGTTKTSKTRLLNPYQLPAHGAHILLVPLYGVCRTSYVPCKSFDRGAHCYGTVCIDPWRMAEVGPM